MDTEFQTISGAGSSSDPTEGVEVLPKSGNKRWVQLVLDNSNWVLERATVKKCGRAMRSRIPFVGACCFWLGADQALYIFGQLAPGGAGTQWDLSVTVCGDAA